MKVVVVFLALINGILGQVARSAQTTPDGLTVELRMSSPQIRITDEVVATVFFRSPEREVTIWNFLEWGAPAGLYLKIVDSTGKEVRNDFAPFLHPLPPDLTGKGELISIGGRVFAGFDSQVAVKTLFPRPGRYTMKCLYSPPLSRHYFQGHTIWGKEDGSIESAPVTVVVDE
jgi:hypothetical protein